jgi:hypothetical protein
VFPYTFCAFPISRVLLVVSVSESSRPCSLPFVIMSGFEALGCAASVLQVIDFGTQFLRKAWEIYRSDTVENLVSDLQSSSTHMQRMQQELQSIPATDEAIQSSAEKCVVILKDLLGSLETVARDGRGRRRHSPRQAFMAVWREDKLKGLEARLDSAKLDLMLHITVNVRCVLRHCSPLTDLAGSS